MKMDLSEMNFFITIISGAILLYVCIIRVRLFFFSILGIRYAGEAREVLLPSQVHLPMCLVKKEFISKVKS